LRGVFHWGGPGSIEEKAVAINGGVKMLMCLFPRVNTQLLKRAVEVALISRGY